jgi:hypothetical protein
MLAQSFPELNFVVQDLPEVEPAFQSNVPQDLTKRVAFQKHDLFTPQTASADIFVLKVILHDWPDKFAIQILRNLLPALRPGGRIMLCEIMSPSPTYDSQGRALLPFSARPHMSSADLQMLAMFSSLERGLDDWKGLVKQADERLEVRNVFSFPGAPWGVLEVVFQG